MRIFKPSYSKPLPKGSKIISRKGVKYAKYQDKQGHVQQARLTKNGDKILLETSHWHIQFEDNQGIRRRIKGFTDRQATQRLTDMIQQILNANGTNAPLGDDLHRQLERLPKQIQHDLTEAKLLDPVRSMAAKPLSELIDMFEQYMRSKERADKYVKETHATLKQLFDDCLFKFWSDIAADKVSTYLKDRRTDGISYRRSNAYLMAFKMFCKWMCTSGYATGSPVGHLQLLNVKLDRRHVRRVLEPEQIRRLLEATAAAPERFGLSGYERSLLYRFAIESGLRANECRTLKVSSFDFQALMVTVEAVDAKGKRSDSIPLRKGTADELKAYFASMLPGTRAFGREEPLTKDTADMIKDDLADANIPYADESGRVFDFHALRHQTGSLLVASGCSPKVAQQILRHTDVNLTMGIYTHTMHGQEAAAIESLPDLSSPSIESQRAMKTGTFDTDESLSKSCFQDGKTRAATDASGKETAIVAQTPASGLDNECARQIVHQCRLDQRRHLSIL